MLTKNRVRTLTCSLLILTILTAAPMLILAKAGNSPATGEIVVTGNSDGNGAYVILDGQKAYNGRTFVSSGTVKTVETGAIVRVKNLGSINLAPNTTMKINLSDNAISATLLSGKVKVANDKGVKVDIATTDNTVSNSGDQASTFNVDLTSGTTLATADVGSIYMNGENTTPITPRQDDDDITGGSTLPMILIFAGVVGVAAYFALRNEDPVNVNISQVR